MLAFLLSEAKSISDTGAICMMSHSLQENKAQLVLWACGEDEVEEGREGPAVV